MVAIAGPPASGKSTLAARLAELLPAAIVVPMDGFHFDDAVLERPGLASRKGPPPTFDVHGLAATLARIRAAGHDVAIPIFDRSLDLSRAAADLVLPSHRLILCEGNYLLLDDPIWSPVAAMFDYRVFLEVPLAVLQERLESRWREFGRSTESASQWIQTNDLPNARLVLNHRLAPNLAVVQRADSDP